MANFCNPAGIAIDQNGIVYIADSMNHTIRTISRTGQVATFAGRAGTAGQCNGPRRLARFDTPTGLAFDRDGSLYVSDTGNHTIRKISPMGLVTTVAGREREAGSLNGHSIAAYFNAPTGLAIDPEGNIFVADSMNHCIRKISRTGEVETFAGRTNETGSKNGHGQDSRFHSPQAIAIHRDGSIYVADAGNHCIRKISRTGEVEAFAGIAGEAGRIDGHGQTAQFNCPHGLSLDREGHVYVTDSMNNTLRRITPSGIVTTFGKRAGLDTPCWTHWLGHGYEIQFSFMLGIAIDLEGNIYFSEIIMHTIGKISPANEISIFAGTRGVEGPHDTPIPLPPLRAEFFAALSEEESALRHTYMQLNLAERHALAEKLSSGSTHISLRERKRLQSLLESQKQCIVCFEPFNLSNESDALAKRILIPCQHILCLSCLETLNTQAIRERGIVKCPTCRAQVWKSLEKPSAMYT